MSERHRIRRGECITTVAVRNGLHWKTIWDHPENRELRNRRVDPNVLEPGDEVFVPDPEPKQESGATEQRHRFMRRGVPPKIHLVVKTRDGSALANEPYVLEIDGESFEGTTDGDGKLDATIPPLAQRGVVRLTRLGVSWPLELGELDPIDTVRGAQQRLTNLGYACGAFDGVVGPKTRAALRAFRAHHGLPGEALDDAARSALEEAHRS